jgi:hypothetical protein
VTVPKRSNTTRSRERSSPPALPPPITTGWLDRVLAFLDDTNAHSTPAQMRAFEIILVVLSVTELWSRALELQRLEGAFPWIMALLVTGAGAVACSPQRRRGGFLLLAVGIGISVWDAFPSTGNHVYLECFLCSLCALLDPADKEEQRLLKQSLRWISCVIMFFAGIQKLVHGYYTTGLMPAFLLQEPRFERIFGLLLPASEAQRIHTYNGLDGSGPYFVTTPLWLLTSNLVWILELGLAITLFARATRRVAVFVGIAFVVLIEAGAREILFGLLYVNLLLMFLPNDANRRLLPIVAVTCVVLILVHLGWLPAMEVH